MNTDPIADMLTRIRNANTVCHETVSIPASKLKIFVIDYKYSSELPKYALNKQQLVW